MKKFMTLFLCIALACVTIMGCGKTDDADDDEANVNNEESGDNEVDFSDLTDDETTTGDADESDRTKLIVGFDANFPPYGYEENGEYVGFDLDLAEEVAKRHGWELVKQPIDWDSKDMELNSGAIDCIWNGFTKSEERLNKYAWTEAYVDNSQVFVVAASSGIESKADLAGKEVVVQADSSALEALNSEDNKELKASFAALDEVPEYNTAFLNLEAGSCDAIAMDIGVAKFQIESRGDDYVILEDLLAKEEYGVGFKLGNESLRDVVENTLKEMVADGKFGEIAEKWELTDSVCLEQ